MPICALFDNGANAVLISPELADNLGLARHKLPLCKDVVMAVGGRKKEIFSFEFRFLSSVPIKCGHHVFPKLSWPPIFVFLFSWADLFFPQIIRL
jgi:hypothetical protein